jgi:HAD superfamily hydrolase (TIGR01490 family)
MTSPGASGTSGAAIFDVDGTLCATRSTTSLVWLRSQQHPAWKHRLWLASLLWRAPLALAADKISRQLADRMVYAQFAGLSRQRLLQDAQRCCDEILMPSCFPQALAEIAAHRQAGRRVILLSGGVDMVLLPLARALGAELLAQRLTVDGDRLTGQYRTYELLDDVPPAASQGESKLQALRRYAEATGIALDASSAYGDSVNDAGMLGLVGRPVAVNPDRGLSQVARQRGWEICAWTHN